MRLRQCPECNRFFGFYRPAPIGKGGGSWIYDMSGDPEFDNCFDNHHGEP